MWTLLLVPRHVRQRLRQVIVFTLSGTVSKILFRSLETWCLSMKWSSLRVIAEITCHGEECPWDLYPVAQGSAAQYDIVKCWLRTKHAIIFRLSNGDIQVSFTDSSEIFIEAGSQMITYRNKCSVITRCPHQQMPATPEFTKRMKYSKALLRQVYELPASKTCWLSTQKNF